MQYANKQTRNFVHASVALVFVAGAVIGGSVVGTMSKPEPITEQQQIQQGEQDAEEAFEDLDQALRP